MPTTSRRVFELAALTLGYYATARVGALGAVAGEIAYPIWPATGLAIASVWLLGSRVLPAVAVGTCLYLARTGAPPIAVLGAAFANTVEPLCAVYLLRRWVSDDDPFRSVRGVTRFFLAGGVLSTAICAALGASSVCASGWADWQRFGFLWLTWWLGDAMGALLVAPLVIAWRSPPAWARSGQAVGELVIVLLLQALVSLAVFRGGFGSRPLIFLCLPLLLLIAFRFEVHGVATAGLLTSAIAVWGTATQHGPLSQWSRQGDFILLQSFMGVVAAVGYVLAATVIEWRRATADLRASQDRLIQAQKMEAVGRLAGGVAHDFNNILTVISGYVDLMPLGLPTGHPHHEMIDEVRKAARRAQDVTRQLLMFSRRKEVRPVVLDVNAAIQDALGMLRRLIGDHILVETRLAPDLGRVKGDPSQIHQVILNLAINARDAMPDGGTLTLETRNVPGDRTPDPLEGEMRSAAYVSLAVKDTGSGMDEKVRSRLFEPFFTTKEPGRGTGLGLATVYGIVHQGAGSISVESAPGRGTTMTIFLPETREPLEPREVVERIAPPGFKKSVVLLAEDDPSVRAMTQRLLETEGYEVLAAGDGVEALQVAERRGAGSIDLLLTDVLMPRMNGSELWERLRAMAPNVKVVFMSGYTDGALAWSLVTGDPLLEKPFTADGLRRALRDAPGRNM